MNLPPPEIASTREIVDELGALEAELLPYKAKFKRAETLRGAIRSAFELTDPIESITVAGHKYFAHLGPRGNESVIDNAGLYRLIGAKIFCGLVRVSLKALTENCSAAIAAAVVSTSMTGTRPLSLVPAPLPVPAPVTPAPKASKRK